LTYNDGIYIINKKREELYKNIVTGQPPISCISMKRANVDQMDAMWIDARTESDLYIPPLQKINLISYCGSHGFSLDLTLSCGQVFSWTKVGRIWIGVIDGFEVFLSERDNQLFYAGISHDRLIAYLGLDHPIDEILLDIVHSIQEYTCCNIQYIDEKFSCPNPDSLLHYDLSKAAGIRVLRQEPWECIASYILSTNSNIRIIRKRIQLLSEKYGTSVGNNGLYVFPRFDVLAIADISDIMACKTGYRAPYLLKTAQIVTEDPSLLTKIETFSYPDAKRELMTLSGIGAKVADCMLLFSYQRYEAVPIDVWIRNIITKRYFSQISDGDQKKMSYEDIAVFCRKYFGKYAGYAQQFIYAARE